MLFDSLKSRCVPVVVAAPLPGPLDYAVPEDMDVGPGSVVRVPLGGSERWGVVWSGEAQRTENVKAILEVLPTPPLPEDLTAFIDFAARYAMAPPGLFLRMALRPASALREAPQRTGFVLSETALGHGLRMTPARRAVLDRAGKDAVSAKDLAAKAGVSEAVVRSLAEHGVLRRVSMSQDAPFAPPDAQAPGLVLEGEQEEAAEALRQSVRRGGYTTTLLDGVTGSGKTEVMLEAAAEALSHGGQVLMLVPEIALTRALVARVQARFGARPAVWHSDAGEAERRRVRRHVAEGTARLVIGARSALFLPFTKLGLILVDEEHDQAYKSDDPPAHHARDFAVARGHRCDVPVVLASATPSLESMENARAGRYGHIRMRARRGGADPTRIACLDLRTEPVETGCALSEAAAAAVHDTLERGERALLFLNRRGYAPITLCKACGEPLRAPDSDTLLVYHRLTKTLVCHHTGFTTTMPKHCPACGAKGTLTPWGPGVERLAEEAAERFAGARLAVLSSDTLAPGMEGHRALAQVAEGGSDILIGTQVLAKGHNIADLTLVVVVDADMGLRGGDLRASERTFQLLTQTAGRAGREAGKPGRALIQTHNPDAAVLKAVTSGDRRAFYEAEAQSRKLLGFPPFGRLAALIVASDNHEACFATAKALGETAPRGQGLRVWGPAPAPIALLRGRRRIRLLLKTPRETPPQPLVAAWLKQVKIPSAVKVQVDIDPYNFL